jgi:uncharacterized protein YndB with AHSA1/START domain
MNKITVQALIAANKEKVWDYYTLPEHIVKWNYASEDWCCPSAFNDMQIGGTYLARMEAKDGSFGFDFEAIYSEINLHKNFTYSFADRSVSVNFNEKGDNTEVVILFDPETINTPERQKEGWQAILDNFKKYTETL